MEASPLDPRTAASLVRRLGEHLDYNINIMDRDGVIIASRDLTRVGSYHEAAHRLIASGRSIESIEPGSAVPAGVKPGVNLPIIYGGDAIGVVGVTGSPSEVLPVAYAVKTSVETMVELMIYKERMLRRQDKKNVLLNYLIYEDETPRAAAEALASKLGYDARKPRAPILFRLGEGVDQAEALRAIKANGLHNQEDISASTPDGAILVFKTLTLGESGVVSSFESQVGAYVEASSASLAKGSAQRRGSAPPEVESSRHPALSAYVGMFQTDFARYRGGYRQAFWLAERYPDAGKGPLFLFQRLWEYFAGLIPRGELVDALSPLASCLPADFGPGLGASVEALFDSSFNGKEAAARLGIHRNTLAARLERLKSLTGMDPRHDVRSRELLSFLSRYKELEHGPRQASDS